MLIMLPYHDILNIIISIIMVLFTIILLNLSQNCDKGRAEIGEGPELENRTPKAFSQKGQE